MRVKIVHLKCGLGNQMFQYAFYLAIKNKYKNTYYTTEIFKTRRSHNGFELERIFKGIRLEKNYLTALLISERFGAIPRVILKKMNKFKIYWADDPRLNPSIKDDRTLVTIYDGYWQSEKYFIEVQEKLKKIFEFPKLDEKNERIGKKIEETESISIHVRRGDYLTNKVMGGLIDERYYMLAISEIEKKVKNPVYFIFSDDIDWCKKNLILEKREVFFISHNKGENSFRDMQLMSLCKHNIIPNSSFSWWGAWLNKNPNKVVIAPEKWFSDISNLEYKDIVPDKWIKIKNF